LNSSGQEFADF